MSDTFDPSKHLRRLRGKGGDADYLDVKWRIVWLRHEHPEAVIVTEKMAGGMEANYAEFRAIVSIPGGGSATGYGSETKADFGDFIEKAETKALGRAIAALGYGTQFVGNELDEGERIVDSPVNRKPEDDDGNTASRPKPQPANQSAPQPRTPSPPPIPRPAVVPPEGGGPPPNLAAVREAMETQDFNATPEGAIYRLQHAATREEAEAARKDCAKHGIESREYGPIYTDTMNRLRAGYASAAG